MIDRPETDDTIDDELDGETVELDPADDPRRAPEGIRLRPIIRPEALDDEGDQLSPSEELLDEPIGDLVGAVSARIADLVDGRLAAEAGRLDDSDPFGFGLVGAVPISSSDPVQIAPIPTVRILLSKEEPTIALLRVAGAPWILWARWGPDTIVRHLPPKIVAALDAMRWTHLADELLYQIGEIDDLDELSALGGFDPPDDI